MNINLKYSHIKLIVLLLMAFSINSICFETKAENDTFSNKKWEDVTKGYNYTENIKKMEPKDREFDNNSNFDGSALIVIVKFIIILIIAGIVILIIYVISKAIISTKSSARVKNEKISFEEIEENLPDIDLISWLNNVLQEGQYKQAIRIHYLLIIQKMSEIELIKWEKDKTNGDYLFALKDSNFFRPFGKLTYIYEKVWYGDIDIDSNNYRELSAKYNSFMEELGS